jgi:hypothetical protein
VQCWISKDNVQREENKEFAAKAAPTGAISKTVGAALAAILLMIPEDKSTSEKLNRIDVD